MKRWFSIVLIFVFLCSTTEFYQFLRIPILIEHYLDHKSNNSTLGFIAFLQLHYDHHVKDADWETDQKLPFLSDGDYLTTIYTFTPKFFIELKKESLKIHASTIISYYERMREGRFICSIWKPPPYFKMV